MNLGDKLKIIKLANVMKITPMSALKYLNALAAGTSSLYTNSFVAGKNIPREIATMNRFNDITHTGWMTTPISRW